MNNRIQLKFADKSVSSIAGYEYGLLIYEEQVKSKIDFNADKIIIVFPEYKSVIASSFVEGFFDNIIKNIGLVGARNKIIIETPYQSIKDTINKCLR